MLRRTFLTGLAFVGVVPAVRAVPKEDLIPGDLITVTRWPKGYIDCGHIIKRYQVQSDFSLKPIGLDGRMEGATRV